VPPATALAAGPLSPAQVEQFKADGFVVVDGLLSLEDDLLPIRRALERKIDRIASALVQTNVIKHGHDQEPFEARMEALAREVPGLPGALHGDRSAVTAMRAVCELWSAPVLLDMVQQLLGTPEIGGHPVINLRIRTATPATKPDADPATVDLHRVPTHQDAAYLLPEADSTLQIGVWVPLVADVSSQGGALSFLRGGKCIIIPTEAVAFVAACPEDYRQAQAGQEARIVFTLSFCSGHRIGRCLPHVAAEDGTGFLSITRTALNELKVLGCESVDCPVPLGSFVVFSNLVPHSGLPNHGSTTRWSVDMRWQPMDAPHGDDHNSGA
jgi:phytanoyl-CoA hydroxylase